MSEKLLKVTVYHASKEAIIFNYSGRGTEEEILTYEDQDGKHEFTGRGIYHDETDMGFMVSGVLEQAPDSHSVMISLMVPDANIPEGMKSINFSTFAVRTTIRDSIAGPGIIEGQIQTYETYPLEGNCW